MGAGREAVPRPLSVGFIGLLEGRLSGGIRVSEPAGEAGADCYAIVPSSQTSCSKWWVHTKDGRATPTNTFAEVCIWGVSSDQLNAGQVAKSR